MNQITSPFPSRKGAVLVAALLSVSAVLLAQYKVDTQVNNQIYGNSAPPPRFTYTNNNLMPSEMRNERFKSGLLPSQYGGNVMAVGPLPSGGNAAYLNPSTPAPKGGVDSRMSTQSGYYNPAPTRQISSSPQAIAPKAMNTGASVKTPTGTTNVRYAPASNNSIYSGSGSIRYGQ